MKELNFGKNQAKNLKINCLQSYLTERSYNILQKHFKTLDAFIEYFKTHKHFLSLKHCGGKTNREILRLIGEITIDQNPIEIDCYKIYSLDSFEKISAESLESVLSFRTFNTLEKNNMRSLRDIISEYLKYNQFTNLLGGGNVTNLELINLMEIICCFRARLREVEKIEAEELDKIAAQKLYKILEKNDFGELYNLLFLCSDNYEKLNLDYLFDKFYEVVKNNKFTFEKIINVNMLKPIEIKKIIESFCKMEVQIDFENIHFFKLIKAIIDNSSYFDEREVFIFKHNFRYFVGEKKNSLRSSGEIIKITRERVRQIKLIIRIKMMKLLSVLSLLYRYTNYEDIFKKDVLEQFVLLSSAQFDKIREIEKVEFSDKFISYVFSVLESDKFVLLNDFVRLNQFYLVQKDFLKYFDMTKFLVNICKRHDQDVYQKERVQIDGILKPYILDEERNYGELKSVVIHFLEMEKNQVYDDDYFIFLPTSRSKLEEAIMEILTNHDKPLDFETLYDEIRSNYFKEDLEKEKVRQICLKSKKIISLGKQNKYALRIWEDEKENVKSGFAIDIAKELLRNSEEPVHKDKLVEYVKKYRKYEKTSIVNMISTHKDIKKFPLAFFGLKDRTYPGKYKCKGLCNQFLSNRIQRYMETKSGVFTRNKMEADLRKRYHLSRDLCRIFINDLLEEKVFELRKNKIVTVI